MRLCDFETNPNTPVKGRLGCLLSLFNYPIDPFSKVNLIWRIHNEGTFLYSGSHRLEPFVELSTTLSEDKKVHGEGSGTRDTSATSLTFSFVLLKRVLLITVLLLF